MAATYAGSIDVYTDVSVVDRVTVLGYKIGIYPPQIFQVEYLPSNEAELAAAQYGLRTAHEMYPNAFITLYTDSMFVIERANLLESIIPKTQYTIVKVRGHMRSSERDMHTWNFREVDHKTRQMARELAKMRRNPLAFSQYMKGGKSAYINSDDSHLALFADRTNPASANPNAITTLNAAQKITPLSMSRGGWKIKRTARSRRRMSGGVSRHRYGGKRRKSHKRRRTRKMRGGYSQYQNNLPLATNYGIGSRLSASESALANPAPFTRFSKDCVDNYNHYTKSGSANNGWW